MIASRVVRSTPRGAYWTIAPGPGSRLSFVPFSSRNSPPDAATCLATMKRAPAVPMNVSLKATPPHSWGGGGEAAGGACSSFCNLRERDLRFLPEVAVVQLGAALERVDLVDRFVVADADDPREAQRVSAQMAPRMLDGVERDLEQNLRPDHAPVTLVLDRDLQEVLRVLRDLCVREPGVRLADVDEPAG